MKIAIASYSFHGMVGQGTMDGFGYLESCKHRYGLGSADIWNGMIPNLEPATLKKFKNALDERELELANLCVDGPHIWEDDPATRETNYKGALEWLKAADYLKARTIRIDAGVRDPKFTTEQLDGIVKRYKEYAQFAHDHGFKVGPENHWGAENDPEEMRKICEGVNHPGFGVLLHFKGKGEEKFAKWAMHTHISWDIVNGNLEQDMEMLKSAGYAGYWSAEHHSGEREYDEVSVQVSKIRAVLRKWNPPVA